MFMAMSRKKDLKTVWLDEGLKVLATKGPGALSIDCLCLVTTKTKGSFYHHFGSREQYIQDLLEHHEKNTMDEIMAVTNEGSNPPERIKRLMKLAFQISGDVELAIRAWALYDPKVKAYQDRLDRRRLDYLKELHMASGLSPDKAEMKSHRDYSLFIGLQQLRHHHNELDFRKILKKVFSDLP
jgi:AcrR family transcriptional regulator